MARYKSRAFVLDMAEFREGSRLLHLLCEKEGVIGMIAKGVYSRKNLQAAASDLFNLVQVNYLLKDGETLAIASSFELEKSFASLRGDLGKYSLANFWLEIVRFGFQARVSSTDIFQETEDFLGCLDRLSDASPLPWSCFLRLFKLLGFGLRLESCARCGSDRGIHCFDVQHGCVFCGNCVPVPRGMIPIDREFRQVIRMILASDPAAGAGEPDLPPGQQARLTDLFLRYASVHLDHRFRSAGFLNRIFVVDRGRLN